MVTIGPTLFVLLILGGLFLDLGIAVATPRVYWNTSLPVFRKSFGERRELTFEDLGRIKVVNPGWTIRWIATDEQTFRVGFRERLFGLSSFYTPIMHGELVQSTSQPLLVGRLNWFPISFSVAFLMMAIEFRAPDFVVALFLIGGALYLVQRYRFVNFGKRCLEIAVSDGSNA